MAVNLCSHIKPQKGPVLYFTLSRHHLEILMFFTNALGSVNYVTDPKTSSRLLSNMSQAPE